MTGLDPTVTVALVAAGAAVAGALLTLLGLFVTRGTETRKLLASAPAGFQQLVNELQEERASLQQERAGLKAEIVRMIERDTARDQELASLRTRMRGLEAEQDGQERRTAALLQHITDLRSALRRAGIVPPPPPAWSGIDDAGHTVTVTVT